MKQDLSDKRKDYGIKKIDFKAVPAHPMEMFSNWFDAVNSLKPSSEPYAMHLSTIEADGFPRSRVVLLREADKDGFVFYTNYQSQKGIAIRNQPMVCLSFFWESSEQQVIIKGIAHKIAPEKSDEYFYSRPVKSQLGAIVSHQSSVIDFDRDLGKEEIELEMKLGESEIKRPESWGGYRVEPVEIEFWQGRPSRLHDRLRYRFVNGTWIRERLSP